MRGRQDFPTAARAAGAAAYGAQAGSQPEVRSAPATGMMRRGDDAEALPVDIPDDGGHPTRVASPNAGGRSVLRRALACSSRTGTRLCAVTWSRTVGLAARLVGGACECRHIRPPRAPGPVSFQGGSTHAL